MYQINNYPPIFISVQIIRLAYPDHLMLYIYLMHCISSIIGSRLIWNVGWGGCYAIVVWGIKFDVYAYFICQLAWDE